MGTTNSEVSNLPFEEKFEIYKNKSSLKLNEVITNYKEWNESQMEIRNRWLIDKIVELLEM